MEQARILIKMELNTRVNGIQIKFKDLESIRGVMEGNIRAIGKIILCMGWGFIIGQMGNSI